MDADVGEPFLVGSATEPVQYRVYPETPLQEVVDLMVRRGVRAVPVVGESFEVLGIITSGDALDHKLKDRPEDAEALAARDVMTRTVLCVSESQDLLDAAHMLVNRDVEQLPVVREGELVGLITRDAILRVLHLGSTDERSSSDS